MEGKEVGICTILLMLCWSAGNCITFDSTVAQDGSGNYKTIAEALNAAPDQSAKPFFINVKAGTYKENVVINSKKTNIALVGDGMGSTIITASTSGIGVNDTATLGVYGNGSIIMKMTIKNTAGVGAGPAAALVSGVYGHVSYYQCGFEGYQDTIFAQIGMQFFRECEIYGTVDFIFGDAQAYFQKSKILARTPVPGQEVTILSPGLDTETSNPGIILQNCIIGPSSDFHKSSVKSYLGRPWKEHGRAVVMSSYINDIIEPQGWLPNAGISNIYFAEYNNKGPGSSTKGRVSWSKNISEEDASQFTVRNFIHGDKWIPDIIPHYLDLNDDGDYV